MNAETSERPRILVDTEAQERFNRIVEVGKQIFADSALVDSSKPITQEDLDKIATFHKDVAPTNPDNLFRVEKGDRSLERGEIADNIPFGNWEQPGGPLEHIRLATQAAEDVARLLNIEGVDPMRVAAAAALHDEGREVTHLFYTNEVIGRAMLNKIGVRRDVSDIMPSESVMLTPTDQSMDDAISNLPPESVIVRIADEFGKRFPGTNRIYQPEDYDAWDRQKWADSYTNRPPSGRLSDNWWREQRQLHVDNVPRYFKALDHWVQGATKGTLSLKDVTVRLDQELSPQLRPLE